MASSRPLPITAFPVGPARHVAATSWAVGNDTPERTIAWRRWQDRRRLRAIAGRAERLTLRDRMRFVHARFLAR